MSNITTSIDVNVPVQTAHNQWNQFEEFLKFMTGIEKVDQLDDRSPKAEVAGDHQEWDAENTEQLPEVRIPWRSCAVIERREKEPHRERFLLGASVVISLSCMALIPWAEQSLAQTPETVDLRIVEGSKVTVEYVLIAPALAGSDQGYVREFIQGRHQILPALEHELTGMKRGDKKQVELAEEVFGPHDDTKIVKVPKSVLPPEAKEGDLLENANGELATLAEMSETRAVLDYNHPFAGKPVVVQVEILKVEDP